MNSDDISTLTEDELSYNSDENDDENSQNEESNLENINLFDSLLYNDFSIYNQSYPEFSYFNNFINSSQINIPNLSNLPNSSQINIPNLTNLPNSQINIPNLSNLPGSSFLHNTPINSLNPSFSTSNLNTSLSLNSSNNFFRAAFSESILSPHILGRFNVTKAMQESKVFKTGQDESYTESLNRTREYFGPVDIQRLSVQLLDEFGRVIDLNNMDWSFVLSFVCMYD